MKKIAFFMFILLVAIQAQAELCWSGVSIPFTKGNGTIEHPYLIESPEQLAFISDMVSLGVDYENTYFLQTNDFNLAQLPWTPIGTSASKPFKGIFHGGGWTISNLKIDQDNYWNYRGLFGYVIGGRLYDISVDETAIFTGKTETEYAGGIVACGKNITIVNCTNASSIACGSSCCGGIVGYLLGTSKVINCINYGKINATPSKAYSKTSYAGGIVGWVDMSCGATINFCRNEGEIYASRTYDQLIKCYAGGIVGFSEGSSYIYQCSNLKYVHAEAECTAQKFNSSSTTNAYSYAGGLIGYSYRFTISESASVGTIRSKVIATGYQMTPTSCAGGLVGGHNSLKTTYSVINSYARGDIQATRVLRDGTGHGSSYGIGSELSFIGNSYFAGTVETEAIEADTVSNCYYNSDCGATFAGKAIAKTTAQLRSSTMAFILGNKWKQNSDTNDGYPYLTEVDKYNIVFYNENYGKVYGVHIGGYCNENDIVYLQAVPHEGYIFLQWDDGNTDNPRMVLAGTSNSYTALYKKKQYNVSVNCLHGIVEGVGTYDYGTQVTLTVIPDEYYHFVKWNDGITTPSREITLTSDTVFEAILDMDKFKISTSGANGSVTGGGTYYYGTEITLTATPNEHYHFVSWSDGVTTSTRKIIVSGDAEYTAIFAIDQFTITVSAENGSITGGGTYDYGTNITLEAIPDEHYHFVKWSDGDTNPTKTLIITTNESISAVFAINQYEITCGGEHGMVTGGGLYDYGAQIILYAIPDEHYHFVKWSDGEESQNRSIIVTESANYLALFEADLFTIQVKSINETMGSVLGSGQYPYDSDVIITAVANNGYEFSQWSDGNKENPRSIHVSKNAQYVAMFTAKNYSVLVLSSDEEQGSVIGSGEYAYNTTITIEALPNVGYSFLQWDDGNTDNPRTILITDNVIFIAQFIHIETNINEPIINSIETCKYIKDNHLIIQRGDKYYDARGVRIN